MRILVVIILLIGCNTQATEESKLVDYSFISQEVLANEFIQQLPKKVGYYLFGNNDFGYFRIDATKGFHPKISYEEPTKLYYVAKDGSCSFLSERKSVKSKVATWFEKLIPIDISGETNTPFFNFDFETKKTNNEVINFSLIINKKGEVIKAWDGYRQTLINNSHAYRWQLGKNLIRGEGKETILQKDPKSWLTHDWVIDGEIFYSIENKVKFIRPHWNFLTKIEGWSDLWKKVKFLLGPSIPIRLNSVLGFDIKTGKEVYRWNSYDHFKVYNWHKYGLRKSIYPFLKRGQKIPKRGFDFLHMNSLSIGKAGIWVSFRDIDHLVLLNKELTKVIKSFDLASLSIHGQHHLTELSSGDISLFNNNAQKDINVTDLPYGPSKAHILSFDNDQILIKRTFNFNRSSAYHGSFFEGDNEYITMIANPSHRGIDYVHILNKDFTEKASFKINLPNKKADGAYRFVPYQTPISLQTKITSTNISKECLSL